MALIDLKEGLTLDLKSINKIRSGDKGIRSLAVSCVAFANARGGLLYIGLEDDTHAPLPGQKVSHEEFVEVLKRIRGNCCGVALDSEGVCKADDGSEYFVIRVYPTVKTIASTADGKFYIRIEDRCMPLHSEDFQRVIADKEAFQWEVICSRRFPLSTVPSDKITSFTEKIRNSPRVSDHIKQMTDDELLINYNLVDNGFLTNLGVLWLGNASQRSRISYPITVQYIVYDALEKKIRKLDWHDQMLNPEELILDIERRCVELTYSFEFPDGMFRKQIRHYHPKVIRELLLNAFAHKSFVSSGDIMIEVYSDRLEISSPGDLPLGVTKDNILHQRKRRNPYFIRIMHDLGLMEGEGSGYDMIYELNSLDMKPMPIIESDYNTVKVTQYASIIDKDLLPLFDYVNKNFSLSQKNIIALGFVARHRKISASDLARSLQLSENERLRHYVDSLISQGILITRGIKKGTQYLVNPKLLHSSRLNVPTTLKTIEPYRLEALIELDIDNHPDSLMSEISSRLPDVDIKDIRKVVYEMVRLGKLTTTGAKTNRRYSKRQ